MAFFLYSCPELQQTRLKNANPPNFFFCPSAGLQKLVREMFRKIQVQKKMENGNGSILPHWDRLRMRNDIFVRHVLYAINHLANPLLAKWFSARVLSLWVLSPSPSVGMDAHNSSEFNLSSSTGVISHISKNTGRTKN